ncbi:hypothetical protein [Limimaricola cinnabarinus]|jgi:hypothetical protein|uniref:Uncharacterized protein n=1 Tax=Limimaricola cinnabarinus TaxID=1125964 RepID=A0A2G1MBJ5_9RHOB|nr:hypothetical protein [Limimaricola cinnabarinus]PHP26103.1 hypothetical protein CJ301_18215 [Limimaricola cinnabarinus]
MNALPPKNLMEQQVDLVRAVLERRSGMARHLTERVVPHLDPDARQVVEETIEFLDEETDIDGTLSYYLDVAIVEVRSGITAGTFEEKVAIPRERLIGGSEAFDIHRRLSPEAEALQAALPPLEELYYAVRKAVNFADAIKMSLRMFDED